MYKYITVRANDLCQNHTGPNKHRRIIKIDNAIKEVYVHNIEYGKASVIISYFNYGDILLTIDEDELKEFMDKIENALNEIQMADNRETNKNENKQCE